MMKNITILLLLFVCLPVYSQQAPDTTLQLQEIIILAKTGIDHDRQSKPTASVEEYLQSSEKVSMI
ncbi:MAG: hypothetical protein LBS43_02040, partial [Prevotellaceae bacterium]|nr:hypothetical protein [Prevotellaceae bacterium]